MYDDRIVQRDRTGRDKGWYIRRDRDDDTVYWEGPFPTYKEAFEMVDVPESPSITEEARALWNSDFTRTIH